MLKTPIQFSKAVTAAGTPERLVAVGTGTTPARSIEFQAVKGPATANTGNIYLGFKGGANNQLRVLAPGDTWNFQLPDHTEIDLHDIWIDAATNADAVVVTYMPS